MVLDYFQCVERAFNVIKDVIKLFIFENVGYLLDIAMMTCVVFERA